METTAYTNVKLIILDVDGVFTDGRKVYNINGEVVYKTFYDKDFTCLNFLMEFFDIVILSGDNRINKPLFTQKGIPFYDSSKKGKKYMLRKILNKFSLGPNACIFVGDDYPDIPCFYQIPLSFCPKDAVSKIKNIAYKILPVYGGDGVITALYDELAHEMMLRKKFGV